MTATSLDAGALRALMGTFRDALTMHREVLNLLNVYPVPDGDTGSNMAMTADSVVAELDGLDDGTVAEMAEGDIYEVVDRYSRTGRIAFVHMRNV